MTLLAGIGPLGVPELLIIAFIIVLVFGVGRLPEVGGAVGKGIREFRKASTKDDDDDGPGASSDTSASLPASASADKMEPPVAPESQERSAFCSECGARNARDAKFCAECGKPIATAVG
jgi:sec-independent protein translocase protein TatA